MHLGLRGRRPGGLIRRLRPRPATVDACITAIEGASCGELLSPAVLGACDLCPDGR